MMLTHDIRDGCWWYCSGGWTYTSIFCYVFLPWDKWQQRDSLAQWRLTWKYEWSIGVSLNCSTDWHSVTLAEHFWRPTSGCEHSEAVWKRYERQVIRWACTAVTPRNEECLDQLTHMNWQITTRELCMEPILSLMCWKSWWQWWNITDFVPSGSHECSRRNRKKTLCRFVRSSWTNTRLKVTVSWITLLLMMRWDVTTTSHSQNGRPWSGDIWNSHWRKSSRLSPLAAVWLPYNSFINLFKHLKTPQSTISGFLNVFNLFPFSRWHALQETAVASNTVFINWMLFHFTNEQVTSLCQPQLLVWNDSQAILL